MASVPARLPTRIPARIPARVITGGAAAAAAAAAAAPPHGDVSVGTPATRPVAGLSRSTSPRHVRYRLHGFNAAEAAFIRDVLADVHGWRALGFTFEQVAGATRVADFDMWLTTPEKLVALYPHAHLRHLSVTDRGAVPPQVHLHAGNWTSPPRISGYARDVAGYRRYVINHEVGHVLGAGHATCATDGGPAPIMMQQTRGTGDCERSPDVVPRSEPRVVP